ncbi:hypothetical protein N7478_002740 [Penicillium angulare]|uniref:uncharacterized protein n=1 Tax=Penicillium angulare TaxID=116970 RepID=UPI002540C383|nr:uncharacterized protein N7478_002740 [Penicillium angulare]KAJ5287054.1 hypothetical protein N7478_002740 [Penicillium angulare]
MGSTTKEEGNTVENAPALSRSASIVFVATVTGAAFINTFASQSVVIILPTIGRKLDIPEARQQWIVTSYVLTFGCFLLLWGRIADIYGKRTIFILGSLWVTVISAVNPFIPNEIGFAIFRGLHGLGAAANVPTAVGILGATFSSPGRAKNYAFSAYACGSPLGSIFGTIVSGAVAQYAAWQWIFGIQAILTGLITVASIYVIPKNETASANANTGDLFRDVDWIGGLLVTVSLFMLLFALAEGNMVGWKTPYVPSLIAISIIMLAGFVAWQLRLEKKGDRPPLLKISLFRNFHFSVTMLANCFFCASFNNMLVFSTYFFQDYQGLSLIQTMLRFLPTGLVGILSPIAVSLALGRVPTISLFVASHLLLAASSLLFGLPLPDNVSYFEWEFWALISFAIGMNSFWSCLTLFVSTVLPKDDQAVAGALMYVFNQLGRAFGLAISTAVQTAVSASSSGNQAEKMKITEPGDKNFLKGIRAASWLDVGFALTSLALISAAFWKFEYVQRG